LTVNNRRESGQSHGIEFEQGWVVAHNTSGDLRIVYQLNQVQQWCWGLGTLEQRRPTLANLTIQDLEHRFGIEFGIRCDLFSNGPGDMGLPFASQQNPNSV
jgi:hypothetical protein